jgi:hypothetical protein
MELNFDVLEAARVGVCFRISHGDATLVILMDSDQESVGRETNL